MDLNHPTQVIINFANEFHKLINELKGASIDPDSTYYKRLVKLFHVFAPVLAAIVFYQYLKYMLVFNAFQYEESVKKRWGYVKKMSKQLRHLVKRYGNFYFCYMPMSHGTTLPSSYSLFMAIKEVLVNSNRPATRVIRANLLQQLIQADHKNKNRHVGVSECSDMFDFAPGEADPLFEFNLDIMKCSREMIIQGVKDFDIMSTVFRVMGTVTEDSE